MRKYSFQLQCWNISRFLVLLAFLSIANPSLAHESVFEYMRIFPLNGRGLCKSSRTTVVAEFGDFSAFCIEQNSFIKTQYGGRVRVINSKITDSRLDSTIEGNKKVIDHMARILEVNCLSMGTVSYTHLTLPTNCVV